MTFAPEGFEFSLEGELSLRSHMVGPRHVAILPKVRVPVSATGADEARRSRILLIEDEMLIAMQLKLDLEAEGYAVIGPFGQLTEGLKAANEGEFDVALIDINLGADNSAPIAEILDRKGVPFAFTTGYNDLIFLPPPLRDYPRLTKPYNLADVRDLVMGLQRQIEERRLANQDASNQVA